MLLQIDQSILQNTADRFIGAIDYYRPSIRARREKMSDEFKAQMIGLDVVLGEIVDTFRAKPAIDVVNDANGGWVDASYSIVLSSSKLSAAETADFLWMIDKEYIQRPAGNSFLDIGEDKKRAQQALIDFMNCKVLYHKSQGQDLGISPVVIEHFVHLGQQFITGERGQVIAFQPKAAKNS
jgi:hypothetical protein